MVIEIYWHQNRWLLGPNAQAPVYKFEEEQVSQIFGESIESPVSPARSWKETKLTH